MMKLAQTDPSLLTQLDRDVADAQPRSIRDFVDTLIERQAKIIDAAMQSQTAVNTSNLRKRYQTYSRAPKLRQRIETDTDTDDHTGTTAPVSITNIIAIKRTPKPPVIAATKWVQSRNPTSEELEWIKLI